MIDLAHEEVDSRLVGYLLKAPMNDGGQYVCVFD
jgi:aminopeptidase C